MPSYHNRLSTYAGIEIRRIVQVGQAFYPGCTKGSLSAFDFSILTKNHS